MSGFNLPNLSNVSLSSVKNLADEFRAKVYPRNETERKVSIHSFVYAHIMLHVELALIANLF